MRKRQADPVLAAGQQRVAELRMQLLTMHPFWGYLLAEVQMLWSTALPTFAATDGVARIWLNPQWIALLSRRQLGFVLLHELGHIVLETLNREETRDRRLWNRATDYAINRQIVHLKSRRGGRPGPTWDAPNVDIPGSGPCAPLLNPRWDHLPAEGIYARLLEDPRGEGGGGESVELADPQGQTIHSYPDHGGGIDVHVPQGGNPGVREQQRDRAAERLREAAEAAELQDPGENLPLGVDRWLAAQRRPNLHWQTLLQRYLLAHTAGVERSWAKPHRRWLAEGWLVPGAVPEVDGVAVFAIDTSGSMNQAQLEAIAAELTALDGHVSELWVVCADCTVQTVVRPGELPAFLRGRRFKGGGGTDHRPVFDWLAEGKVRPDLLICCTDLYTILPVKGPAFSTLWLVTPDRQGHHGPRPRFGEVVVMAAGEGAAG